MAARNMQNRASDEESIGPLERGRSRYMSKNYAGALESFTEATTISSGHLLLTALDHRAATYEKLDQLQDALRDAKAMIDLKPDLAKGYLRCAKVLQIKGETELALKIYERGLKKVKIGGDPERTVLQSMHNKLQRKQTTSKTFDPLVKLPLELAEIVCQNLDMRDRVYSICLAVTKDWKRILESSHKLWTTLDTTSARRPVTQESLRVYLRRSNYTLNRAIIKMSSDRTGGFNEKKMDYLTKTCKQLRHLEISGPGVIGDSLIKSLPNARSLEKLAVHSNCEISLGSVISALEICRNTLLEASFLDMRTSYNTLSLSFPKLPLKSLTTLRLGSLGRVNQDWGTLDMNELCHATPNVTHITLTRWHLLPRDLDLTKWSNLSYLDLSRSNLLHFPVLPSTLQHLNVNKNYHLSGGWSESSKVELPLLETLKCQATKIERKFIIKLIAPSIEAGNLKTLHMGSPSDLRPANDLDEYPLSKTVETLSIGGGLPLEEARVLKIVSLYPNVHKLDVSGTKVTGVAVKAFIDLGIKQLKATHCSSVSSDAIELARSQDIVVEFSFPSLSDSRKFVDNTFSWAF